MTFIIYALPRSRTYWLSQFLSTGGWHCLHEELRHIRNLEDVRTVLDMPMTGCAETAAAPFWRLIQAMRPDVKTVVIRRPVDAVVRSLMRTGVQYDEAQLLRKMQQLNAKLDQIEARVPGVLSVPYDDLAQSAACECIFKFCTGVEMPAWRFETMAVQNLTCDLAGMTRYTLAHLPQFERVGRQAKQRMLAGLHRGRNPVSEAMTFQQEPFDDFLRDGEKLFAQHLIEVGESPDNWKNKNLALMRALGDIGALHVTTARSNGRMFGYLISIVSPALDSQDGRDGTHTLFYGSPDVPGIGLKLQRASGEFLRSKGVDQIALRAGTRGTGPKQDALFRRMGAQEVGKMYVLDLKGAA